MLSDVFIFNWPFKYMDEKITLKLTKTDNEPWRNYADCDFDLAKK